ncbi:MAG: signal peptidase I [Salinirussus sp.]
MLKKVGVVVFVALALALVAPAASPVQVSYVTSDSMEPEIGTNDGYVLVPAGEVVPGEIITFYSGEREGYVTHRVVGTTTGGYLTRGDANPSTDQAAGSPPIEREAVAGQVLTVGRQPVLIPQLGTAVELARGNWLMLSGLVGLVVVRTLAGSNGGGGRDRTDRRPILRSRQVIAPILLIALLASVVLISMGTVHTELSYSVTESGGEDPRVLTVGENTTTSLNADVVRSPLTEVLVDTEGMALSGTRDTNPTSAANATSGTAGDPQSGLVGTFRQQFMRTSGVTLDGTIPAQAEPGSHTVGIDVYPYPATLPRGALEQLHAIHPWLAALGSALVVYVPGWILYWLLVDTTAPIRRSRRRWLRRSGER